jgi:hypothetical protein
MSQDQSTMVRDKKKKKRVLYNDIDDLLFLNSPSNCPNNCVNPDKPCSFKYEIKCPWKWEYSERNDDSEDGGKDEYIQAKCSLSAKFCRKKCSATCKFQSSIKSLSFHTSII